MRTIHHEWVVLLVLALALASCGPAGVSQPTGAPAAVATPAAPAATATTGALAATAIPGALVATPGGPTGTPWP